MNLSKWRRDAIDLGKALKSERLSFFVVQDVPAIPGQLRIVAVGGLSKPAATVVHSHAPEDIAVLRSRPDVEDRADAGEVSRWFLGWHLQLDLLIPIIPTAEELGPQVQVGRAGVGLVQAQRLLGHSTPELTAQVYTHLGIDDLRSAVEKLEPVRTRRAKRGA